MTMHYWRIGVMEKWSNGKKQFSSSPIKSSIEAGLPESTKFNFFVDLLNGLNYSLNIIIY